MLPLSVGFPYPCYRKENNNKKNYGLSNAASGTHIKQLGQYSHEQNVADRNRKKNKNKIKVAKQPAWLEPEIRPKEYKGFHNLPITGYTVWQCSRQRETLKRLNPTASQVKVRDFVFEHIWNHLFFSSISNHLFLHLLSAAVLQLFNQWKDSFHSKNKSCLRDCWDSSRCVCFFKTATYAISNLTWAVSIPLFCVSPCCGLTDVLMCPPTVTYWNLPPWDLGNKKGESNIRVNASK